MKKIYTLLITLTSLLLLNATPFFNGTPSDFGYTESDSTFVSTQTITKFSAFYQHGSVYVEGVNDGEIVEVYSLTGSRIVSALIYNGKVPAFYLAKGIYIVKCNNQTCKIVVN